MYSDIVNVYAIYEMIPISQASFKINKAPLLLMHLHIQNACLHVTVNKQHCVCYSRSDNSGNGVIYMYLDTHYSTLPELTFSKITR